MKRNHSNKFLITKLLFIFIIIGFVVCLFISKSYNTETVYKQKVNELEELKGQYDEKSIILDNTSKERAKIIADEIGAKLRISANGEFATLTLPEGLSVSDVYTNKNFKKYISEMSLDTYVSLMDVEEDESQEKFVSSSPEYTVTDPDYNKESWLNYLNLSDTWTKTMGKSPDGKKVTVAIIDTGIDYYHPEFFDANGDSIISEWSYNATEDKIVKDYVLENGEYDWSIVEDQDNKIHGAYHGTRIAGVIAAQMNNGKGITGIAPDVELLVIKLKMNDNGNISISDCIYGLYYAIERNVDIVNMSLGGDTNQGWIDPVELAYESDIICVASAGNSGSTSLTYPAALEHVIGVGALEENTWEKATYSNYGDWVDVFAPEANYSTTLHTLNGGYDRFGGTSSSCPVVAAVLALYISQNKYIEFDTLYEVLIASTKDIGEKGFDFVYGYGAIDANALIWEEKGTVTFDYLTDEIDESNQVFVKNHALQNLPTPERLNVVFDGWFYDIHCENEVNYYEDKWPENITLYAKWSNEDEGIPWIYTILDDGTIELNKYLGKRKYVSVPSEIDGITVTSIGGGCFAFNTNVKRVVLPDELKYINDNAFYYCVNLTEISIPKFVEKIGKNAFANCYKLELVDIYTDGSLKTIDEFAFENCGLNKNINLSQSLSTIGEGAFKGCSSIISISIPSLNNYYQVFDGAIYTKDFTELVYLPAGVSGSFVVNSDTKVIDCYAFYGSNKTEIILPEGLTSLGSESFSNSKITSIIIPSSVLYIEDSYFNPGRVFAFCACLKSVIFEDNSNLDNLGQKCFMGCESLENVDFGKNSFLSKIDAFAFYGCSSLKTINIPNFVQSINSYAFQNSGISNLVFGENSMLKEVSSQAFYGCLDLKNIDLPESVNHIGDFAFEYSGLKSFAVGKSVVELGDAAFAYCEDLLTISVDSLNTKYYSVDNTLYYNNENNKRVLYYRASGIHDDFVVPSDTYIIDKYAFAGRQINNISFNEGLNEIKEKAFYNCINIKNIVFPESLETIGPSAFQDCYKLGDIVITKNIINISRYAFANDFNISNITFEEGTKISRLGFATFALTGIRSITIPANVTSIAQYAFSGCKFLGTVEFEEGSKLDRITAYMFDGANNLKTIRFPESNNIIQIQARAFSGMSLLENINLEVLNKLEVIDNYAFWCCTSLKNVVLPDNLLEIGRYAFNGCRSLTRIDIPVGLDFIGRYAFANDKDLNIYFKSANLPSNMQDEWNNGIKGYYIGVKEIIENSTWEYAILIDDTVSLIKYKGNNVTIDISMMDGKIVSSIGAHAFDRNASIQSITLPNTIKTIEKYAFANTIGLREISIPNSVVNINDYAFYNSKIANITLSNTLTKIGKYAFANTSNLSSISIPNTVKKIGNAAFKNSSISSVIFETSSVISEIPEEAFYGTKISSIVLPDSVTRINNNAFRDTINLTSVVFGCSDLRIDANAFNNSGITGEFIIPSNVYYIGEYCFNSCEKLTSFNVSADNQYYSSKDGVLFNKDKTKLINMPLTKTGSYTIDKNVKTISFGAFEGSKLSNVVIPEDSHLLTIGYRAFANMKNIKSFSVPKSILSIGYYAFANCDNLESIFFSEDSQLDAIFEGAFYNCARLSNIELPKTILEISNYAFYGCESINGFNFVEESEVIGIYDYALSYTNITEFVSPKSCEEYGYGIFAGCENITSLTMNCFENSLEYYFGSKNIPSSLKNIEIYSANLKAHAFEYGTGLDSVVLYNIKSISNNSFSGVSSIVIVIPDGKIPSNVTEEWIRGNCVILEECEVVKDNSYLYAIKCSNNKITLVKYYGNDNNIIIDSINGKAVDVIGENAFKDKNINSISFVSDLNRIDKNAFNNCLNLSYVSYKNIEQLCNISYGDEYSNPSAYTSNIYVNGELLVDVKIPNSFTKISNFAFRNYNIEKVEMPNTIIEIGNNAFENCSKLNSINLSNSIDCINNYTFAGCSSLRSIEIPNDITSIGDYAFYSTSLEAIELPDSVLKVGEYAFAYTSISSVKLSNNLNKISKGMFSNCDNLKSIDLPDSVYEISDFAFESCINLEDIDLNNVRIFKAMVFANCNSLDKIIISKNVEKISEHSLINENMVVLFEGNSTNIIDGSFENLVVGASYFNISKVGKNEVYSYALTKDSKIIILSYLGYNKNIEINDIEGKNNVIIGFKAFASRDINNVVIGDSVTLIDDSAFYASNISSVKIGKNVTNIGKSAFANSNLVNVEFEEGIKLEKISDDTFSYTRINSIIIPDGVKEIGSYAFAYCSNLNSISIPDSLRKINDRTFIGCKYLKSIELNENINYIGNYAFYNCDILTIIFNSNSLPEYLGDSWNGDCLYFIGVDEIKTNSLYQYIIDSNYNAVILNYVGNIYELDIDEIDGYKAISISAGAFKNSSIRSVKLGESIENIGNYAFYDSSLTEVEFANNSKLRTIGDYALYCRISDYICIPSSVESIGSRAFNKLSVLALESSTYPKDLGFEWNGNSNVYLGISGLSKDNRFIYFVDSNDYAYILKYIGESKNVVIDYAGGYYIKRILNSTFENVVLEILDIEAEIEEIETNTFYGITTLKKVSISNSVTKIGESAFRYCENLTEVSFAENSNLKEIGNYAFAYCSSLESISLPNSLEVIGSNAFYGCYNLSSCIITDASLLRRINYYSFNGCSNLTSLYIPSFVEEINESAFSNCTKLAEIRVSEANKNFKIIDGIVYNINSKSILFVLETLPSSITLWDELVTISDRQFESKDIVNIVLPESITSIGSYAFSSCSKLECIEVRGFVYISDYAFYNVNKDAIIKFDSYAKASEYWSERWDYLLEGRVEYLGNSSNQPAYTEGLQFSIGFGSAGVIGYTGTETNVVIPSTYQGNRVTYISARAFYNNEIIKTVNLGNINIIDNYAFYNCSNLESITIPSSVTMINQYAFSGCSKLSTVVFEEDSKIYSIGDSAFSNCESIVNLELPDSITQISNFAFSGCLSLESVKLPKYLGDFSQYIFGSICYLKQIVLPVNMTTINQTIVFRNLTSIYIPDSAKTIAAGAFSGCSSLKSINFGESSSLMEIGDNAFSNCKSLESLVLPNSLTTIGKDALAYCEKLEYLYIPRSVSDFKENKSNYNAKIIIDEDNPYYLFKDGILYNKVGNSIEWYKDLSKNLELWEGLKVLKTNQFGYFSFNSLLLPEGIEIIEDNAFYSRIVGLKGSNIPNNIYYQLNYIDIYNNITKLGEYSKLSYYEDIDGKIYVIDVSNIEDDVLYIPDKINGKDVCKISFDITWISTLNNVKVLRIPVLDNNFTLPDGHLEKLILGENVLINRTFNGNYKIYCHESRDDNSLSNNWFGSCTPYYEGEWSEVLFYDYKGDVMSFDVVTNDDFVKVPLNKMIEVIDDNFTAEFVGWDINGDGVVDNIPSSVGSDLKAYAIYVISCKHRNIINIHIDATCERDGLNYEKCIYCNKVINSNVIPALGHDLIHHEGREPLCCSKGWLAYDTCSRCNYTTYSEIAPLGHKVSDAIQEDRVEPTCTDDGYYDSVVYCSVCHTKLSSITYKLDKLGHTAGEVVEENRIESTCLVNGHYDSVIYCSVCHEELSRNDVSIAKLGHDLIHHDSMSPTCNDYGWNSYDTCSRCDYNTFSKVPALGHTNSDAVVENIIEATCTEDGHYDSVVYCSVCHTELIRNTLVIEKLGHDLVHHDGNNSTCTESGYEEYDACNRCDYTTYKVIPALGHDLVHHDGKNPTCTSAGYEEYDTCSICDYTTHKVIPALGHDLVHHEACDPTCTTIGWNEYDACSRCDYSTYSEIIALGHDLVHHDAKPSSCTENGWIAYDACSRCDYTTYQETALLGHDLVHYEGKNPTCTEKGWLAYDICNRCDYTTYKDVNALGHDLVHHEGKDPTYESNGWRAYDTCNRCNFTTYVEIPALTHKLIYHEGKNPTCTEVGWNEYYTCEECEYSTYVEIPALGHTRSAAVVENKVDATCLEDGHYDSVIYCSVCHVELSRDEKIINRLDHDYVHHDAKNPNCTDIGYDEYYTCSRCDYTTYVEIPALGHDSSPVVEENVVPATCTENGHYDQVVYCSLCNIELRRNTYDIQMLGHDLVSHNSQNPTCTEVGWNSYFTCNRCDYTSYKEIPARGHFNNYPVYENYVDATCLEDGHYDVVVYCFYCQTEISRTTEVLNKLGHSLTQHNSKLPTCTEVGWSEYYTCSRCDYSTYEEISALGHDLLHFDAKDPTCNEMGWVAYDRCRNCSYNTYEELDALGHDVVHHDAKDPTCTEVGWKAYDTCNRCDYTTYEEIKALGHDLQHFDGKNPTCTEGGWVAYDRCRNCSYNTYEELDALGHDVVCHDAKDPTCTEVGWSEYYTCNRCDYSTYEEISVLGHDLIHHEEKDATYEENGWKAYDTCSRCDYSTYVEIPALTHKLIYHEGKNPTCTSVGWNEYYTCEECEYSTYVEIPALGHVLGEITYYDYGSCIQALNNCPQCGSTLLLEESDGKVKVIDTVGNCSTKGTYHYEAEFKNPTCKKYVGETYYESDYVYDNHKYEYTVTFTSEGYCYEVGTCVYNNTHEVRNNVKAEFVIDTLATCTENALGHYAATIVDADGTSRYYESEINGTVLRNSALKHNYEVTYKWTHNVCEATAVCKNDGSHIVSEVVEAYFVSEEQGYFASFNNYAIIDSVYSGANTVKCVYVWNEDNCILQYTWVEDNYVISSEELEVKYVKDTSGTCESLETGHYEAYKNGLVVSRTERGSTTAPGVVTGHDYEVKYYVYYPMTENAECLGYATCKVCRDYISETVPVTYFIDSAATCTEDETGHYECLFTNRVLGVYIEEAGSRVKSNSKLNHNYTELTYTWNGEYCTALIRCLNDESHNISETVEGTYIVRGAATCMKDECGYYKATFTNPDFSFNYSDDVYITGTKLEHDYKVVGYYWDGNKCTAYAKCTLMYHEQLIETVEGIYVKDTDATLLENERGHYIAIFGNPVFETQEGEKNSVIVNGTYLGYCEKVYTWDGEKCIAQAFSYTDGSLIVSEVSIGVYVKDTSATCSKSETGHYEASFSDVRFVTQKSEKFETGYYLSHYVSKPTYSWDGEYCTASGRCLLYNTCKSEVVETVKGVYVKDTDATFTTNEKGHLVATFENSSFKTQSTAVNSYEVEDSMLSNKYNRVYEWKGFTSCIAYAYDKNDGSLCFSEEGTITLNVSVSATCSSNAKGVYVVAFTNSEFSTQYSDEVELENTMIEHSLVHIDALKATCTEDGYEAYDYCKNCDYSTLVIISKLNHDLVHVDELKPTCTEDGYNEYDYCTRCDYTTYVKLDKLGHKYDLKVTVEATCTLDGTGINVCINCLDSVDVIIPMLGHDLVHVEGKEATCTSTGYEAYDRCNRCDYSTYVEIPSVEHKFVTSILFEATCEFDGIVSDKCIYCDFSQERIVSKLEHDLEHVSYVITEATCKSTGTLLEADVCSMCKEKFNSSTSEIPMIEHKLSLTEKIIKNPTCLEEGIKLESYTCFMCNTELEHNEIIIPKLEHLFEHATIITKDATCTEDGIKVECQRCKICGTKDNEIESSISALGHNIIHHEGKNPTTKESGYEAYDTCSRCDYTTYKELDKLESNGCNAFGFVDVMVFVFFMKFAFGFRRKREEDM